MFCQSTQLNFQFESGRQVQFQYYDRLSNFSKNEFYRLFTSLLNLNHKLLEEQESTHCDVHVYETRSQFILMIVTVQKCFIVDKVEFRQNYISINGWSIGSDNIICGATINNEGNTIIFGPGCIKRQNYSHDVQVIEIEFPNQLVNTPLAHLSSYGLVLPQVVFFTGPLSDECPETLSYIPSSWIQVMDIQLCEQASLFQNSNSGNFEEFIHHIYESWRLTKGTKGLRHNYRGKENISTITNPAQIKNQNKFIFKSDFKQMGKLKKLQAIELTPIFETKAENFISSAKNYTQELNQFDDMTSNLLQKYGLQDPQQSNNLNSNNTLIQNDDILDFECSSSQIHQENYQYQQYQNSQNFRQNNSTQYQSIQQSNQQNHSIQNQQLPQFYQENQQQQQIYPQQISQDNYLENQKNYIQYNQNQQQQNEQELQQQYMYPQYQNQQDLYLSYLQALQYQEQIQNQQWNQYQTLFSQQTQYQQQFLHQQILQHSSLQPQNLNEIQNNCNILVIDQNSVDKASVNDTSIQIDKFSPNKKIIKSLNQSGSHHSNCQYENKKDSLLISQDDCDKIMRIVNKRLSIKQNIEDSNKNKSENILRSKLEEIGGFYLNNESNYSPNLKFNDVQPFDFYEYQHNHAQKKMDQILQDLGTFKKRGCQRAYLQLYKDEKFVDLCLKLHNKEFKTHKIVLISISPYFKQLIGTVGASFSTIRLENQIDLETFPFVMKFIYLQKLSQSEWEEITLEQGKKLIQTSLHFQVNYLSEQIIAKVIIPKMNVQQCLEWFSLCCKGKIEITDSIYMYGYLYSYLLRFFSLYAKQIIIPIQKYYTQIAENLSKGKPYSTQNQMHNNEYDVAQSFFVQIDKLKSVSFTDLIMNAIQKYQVDIETIENLIWILKIKLKVKDNFELCNIFSLDYTPIRGGFIFKDISEIGVDNYYNGSQQNQPFAYPRPQKPIKKRNSIFQIDAKETINEDILQQHNFSSHESQADAEIKFNKLQNQQCDYELTLRHELSSISFANYYVISQCFTSGNATWRMILDVDQEHNVSVYFQEKGSLKSNAKYFNFKEQEDTLLPEPTQLDFISIILRIEVITEARTSLTSRCFFHSFPTKQSYSAGFSNLFNLKKISKKLQIKIWIIENPIHSAILNIISQDFETHLRNDLFQVVKMSHYDLYTLTQSDQLNIQTEDSLIPMLCLIDKENQLDLDLVLYPIRLTYISNKQILTLSRDCKMIKQSKLFQNFLSLIFHWNINGSQPIQPRSRRKYKCITQQLEMKQNSNFKDDLISWLVQTSPEDLIQFNVDHMKQEIVKSTQFDFQNDQKKKILAISTPYTFSQQRPLKYKQKEKEKEIVLPIKEVLPKIPSTKQLKGFEVELPCNLL